MLGHSVKRDRMQGLPRSLPLACSAEDRSKGEREQERAREKEKEKEREMNREREKERKRGREEEVGGKGVRCQLMLHSLLKQANQFRAHVICSS